MGFLKTLLSRPARTEGDQHPFNISQLTSMRIDLRNQTSTTTHRDDWQQKTAPIESRYRRAMDTDDLLHLRFKGSNGKDMAAPQPPYFYIEKKTRSNDNGHEAPQIRDSLKAVGIDFCYCELPNGKSRIIVVPTSMARHKKKLRTLAQSEGVSSAPFHSSRIPLDGMHEQSENIPPHQEIQRMLEHLIPETVGHWSYDSDKLTSSSKPRLILTTKKSDVLNALEKFNNTHFGVENGWDDYGNPYVKVDEYNLDIIKCFLDASHTNSMQCSNSVNNVSSSKGR